MRLLEEIELDEAQARLDFAAWNYYSLEHLSSKGAAPEADKRRARMELDLAKLAKERAELRLKELIDAKP